jgi:hypothetical protein
MNGKTTTISRSKQSITKPWDDVKETFPHPTSTNRGTITKSRMNDSIEQKSNCYFVYYSIGSFECTLIRIMSTYHENSLLFSLMNFSFDVMYLQGICFVVSVFTRLLLTD